MSADVRLKPEAAVLLHHFAVFHFSRISLMSFCSIHSSDMILTPTSVKKPRLLSVSSCSVRSSPPSTHTLSILSLSQNFAIRVESTSTTAPSSHSHAEVHSKPEHIPSIPAVISQVTPQVETRTTLFMRFLTTQFSSATCHSR